MTDLHDLLDHAAGPAAAPNAADLAADVARGMRALRRRRTGVAGGVLTVAVAAAAIPAVLGGAPRAGGGVVPGGSGGPAASSSSTGAAVSAAEKKQAEAAQLRAQTAAKQAAIDVAAAAAKHQWLAGGASVPIHTYDGPAVDGSYQPGMMPEGSTVQGGNGYRLTIARVGDPDTNPDSFTGKVVVLLAGTPAPAAIEVQHPDGFASVVIVPLDQPIDGATAFEVQYPAGLGWTDNEAIKFASSVTVLPTALAGKG